MIIVGVDTGVNCGISVWNTKTQQFESIGSMMIHRAFDLVLKLEPAFLRVEDARLMKLPPKFQKHKDPKTFQNIGSVKRDAKCWQDFLTDYKFPFELVSPAHNIRKLTQKQFEVRTGCKIKTNEHGRDASMLVHGWTDRNVRNAVKIYG